MGTSTIIPWAGGEPAHELIDRVADVLTQGGLVVAPTETRYGLLVRHDDDEALQQLYEVKGRPISMPTAFFVRDERGIDALAEVNDVARRLVRAFLPGPLTLVLRAQVNWSAPRVVDGKIGTRWSSSELIAALVERVPFLVTATSANVSGGKELESVKEIAATFGDGVDVYIDGGRLDGPVSTVVDCSSGRPVILRAGAIAPEVIERAAEDFSNYE